MPADPLLAAPGDVERVAHVLTAAMANDLLNAHFFPDTRTRARALDAMYRLVAMVAVQAGAVHVSSRDVEAVALWDLPGRAAFDPLGLQVPAVLSVLRRVGIARSWRLGRYEAWAGRLLARHVSPPRAHLLLVAVDPGQQGRGHASRLLRPTLQRLLARDVAVCLETQNPANLPIYEHLGFHVVSRGVVPGSHVRHWVMAADAVSRVGKARAYSPR